MDLEEYKQHLVNLAQKWRTGRINDAGYQELDSWYRSLEDIPLGHPIETAVDGLEKRLHEQLYKNVKQPKRDDDFNVSLLFSKSRKQVK